MTMSIASGHPIDLSVLLETRLLVQANSGGGKSWAIRRLLEQTAPNVQQLIIDPEGEFSTLREKFDYVIAAPHDGDALASPQTAALLARRLLESGVSAILDIYDLKSHERTLFVKRFLEALVNAPKSLWHPVLIVLDEAHVYAPQVGSAESLGAVIDIATRGRKRGQCLVAATQRLSKLHKDVAAELGNKMIGLTNLDIDVKRAADELGLNSRDAIEALRNIPAGEFYLFGPALSRNVQRVKVGPVQTHHPRAGQRLMEAPPAPSPKLRAQLAKLADLQKDAEQEARTVEELQAKNAQLAREITAANKRAQGAGVPEAEVVKRISAAIAEFRLKHPNQTASDLHKTDSKVLAKIGALAAQIARLTNTGELIDAVDAVPVNRTARSMPVRQPAAHASPSAGLTGPEQRILDAIAWLESIGVSQPEQPAVAFLADYAYGAGSYNNPRGKLKARGMVEYLPDSRIQLTELGRGIAKAPAAPGTTAELHERILGRLPGPEQRLLRPLLEAYPKSMSNADLAEASGYAPGAGSFNNPRGRLRTLGLIEYPAPGQCVARSLLFPEIPA